MGTNYYLVPEKCAHCGRSDERIHIGKSSAGWCFSLRVIPQMGLCTWENWKTYLADKSIEDEYRKPVTLSNLRSIVEDRSWNGPKRPDTSEWYKMNGAEPGPNGLARHLIDHEFCVGHGPGTWDMILSNSSIYEGW